MATQPNQASSTKQPNYTNPNANPNPNPNTNPNPKSNPNKNRNPNRSPNPVLTVQISTIQINLLSLAYAEYS